MEERTSRELANLIEKLLGDGVCAIHSEYVCSKAEDDELNNEYRTALHALDELVRRASASS